MTECLFCKIVAGEIPSTVVLDGDRIFAFRDLRPVAPTHILIVPREHIRDVSEVDPSHGGLLAEIVRAASELARSEGIVESGYRLVANVGPDAGQSVFHLHVHLIGGRAMAWPPG